MKAMKLFAALVVCSMASSAQAGLFGVFKRITAADAALSQRAVLLLKLHAVLQLKQAAVLQLLVELVVLQLKRHAVLQPLAEQLLSHHAVLQ